MYTKNIIEMYYKNIPSNPNYAFDCEFGSPEFLAQYKLSEEITKKANTIIFSVK